MNKIDLYVDDRALSDEDLARRILDAREEVVALRERLESVMFAAHDAEQEWNTRHVRVGDRLVSPDALLLHLYPAPTVTAFEAD